MPSRLFPVIMQDENENHIVFESADRRISVNQPGNANTVVLWVKQNVKGKDHWRKAGSLYTEVKTKKLPGEIEMKNYISISSIEIDKECRGEGLGKKMYQILIDHAPEDIAGIISYTPNRSNKKQVPAIYRALGGYEIDDWQLIPIDRRIDIDLDPISDRGPGM